MNTLWTIVLSNSLVVSGLALGIVLLGRFWKHAAVLHVLWTLVLLKLFVPPVFVTNWQVSLVQSHANVAATGEDGVAQHAPIRDTSSKPETRALSSNRNAKLPGRARAIDPMNPTAQEVRAPITWEYVLIGIWIAGALALATRSGVAILRFRRLLENTVPGSDKTTQLVANLARRIGLARTPTVRMTTVRVTPLVWSVGSKPVLVLPEQLFARLDQMAQESILIHELAHLRRRDHLVRLLELAATIVFWWHPVVWLARGQMRDLEEQCCDQIVVEFDPRRKRSYATALVDTLDFLSGCIVNAAPLSTAILSTDSLVRRIKLLEQEPAKQLTLAGGMFMASVLSVPLAFGLAPAGSEAPTISGRVTNIEGNPIKDALVRVALPATDMRYVDEPIYETRSDEDGRYKVELKGLGLASSASLDALAPGYQRLSGPQRMYRPRVECKVGPGIDAEASFTLEPGLYVKGIVVDEAGEPVSNVRIGANAHRYGIINGVEQVVSSGGIERTKNREDGTFEVFNYPSTPFVEDGKAEKGFIGFLHPDYVPSQVEDVYALSDEERTNLRIVLPTGSKATGRVIDATGNPVANVMVEVLSAKEDDRDKATMTDSDGKFQFSGLQEQEARVRVHAMDIEQKAVMPVNLEEDQLNLETRLQPLPEGEEPQSVEVLGMKLSDITPELSDRYDLYHKQGALILDPGENSARLGVGELREGYYFWLVGEEPVASVRELVEALIKEAEKPGFGRSGCRVVYTFRDVRMTGTNTQYMKLTEEDVQSLRRALEAME